MNYSIAESYTLPSLGKVYSPQINPDIKIRSMTTLEEMKRLAKSDRPYKNMSEVIDDCLVEKPDILSSYDCIIGDYQFLLHKLRIVTYGPEYSLSSTCPHCGQINKGMINLDQLAVLNYSEDFIKYQKVTLPVCGKEILLKLQTPRILDNITLTARDYAKRSKTSGDFTYIATLQNLVKTIDGNELNGLQAEEFAKNLPMKDANILLQSANKLNNMIGIDTNFEIDCENCGLTYKSSFRITTEFFGPRIDI